MAEPKFAVGDLVTRGRGRPTYRIIASHEATQTNPDQSVESVRMYSVANVKDERKTPRVIWIAEHNLRKKEA